jgi:hypothetical protein
MVIASVATRSVKVTAHSIGNAYNPCVSLADASDNSFLHQTHSENICVVLCGHLLERPR